MVASENLGIDVPEPFYKGFPESVRNITKEQFLFNQMIHYVRTYGFGDFSETGHAYFEEKYDRIAFAEDVKVKEFTVVTEEEAIAKLEEYVRDMLASTRPLNNTQFEVVKNFVDIYGMKIESIASKNTCIKLLIDSRNMEYARFLNMSDVAKLVDELNYSVYNNTNVKKLNFKNVDRVFVTKVINTIAANGKCDVINCYEKKKIFNGLLHHIHYVAKTDEMKEFVACMRDNSNNSVYSKFEKKMGESDILGAVEVLKNGKGSGAVVRNLVYIISRCRSKEEVVSVLDSIDASNGLVLLQLLYKFANKSEAELNARRVFTFSKYNLTKVHKETEAEQASRKSLISKENADIITSYIEKLLEEKYAGKIGKLYIDTNMKNYALPISENTSNSGVGVLSRGSKLSIGNGNILRAFTYWEKVDDIDLSVMGFEEDGKMTEFSWRTMADQLSSAILYSGDETSGYNGGSEYYDINISEMKKLYPKMRYLVFCNNVYSGLNFSKCFCKAGYMKRSVIGSGEIYEPKTVQSSFIINSESTFAYLFGVDLYTRELIWLNMSRTGQITVAGTADNSFLLDAFKITEVMNMDKFFRLLATEVVDDPREADVIVTDKDNIRVESEDGRINNNAIVVDSSKMIIREYDFEKMMALMND